MLPSRTSNDDAPSGWQINRLQSPPNPGRTGAPSRRLHGAWLLATCLLWVCGCQPQSSEEKSSEAESSQRSTPKLSDFQLTKDSEDVLYTWVDDAGAFQITQQAEEIPQGSRGVVRVVVDGKAPGTSEEVFVADLTNMNGTFPVSRLSRQEWEKKGQAERAKRVAELRPPEVEKGPSPADLGVDAIIYGADWCKPCHLAEDYLKRKGARVLKKDIEEDASAAAEMQAKLKAAKMQGSSIPVLDVGGTILKGFSTASIDKALKKAQGLTKP